MDATDVRTGTTTETRCPECRGARSITDYSPSHGYIDIACPACEGAGTILDPEPPTPAAPALVPCRECGGGTVRYSTGFGLADWIEEPCRWCEGTGHHADAGEATPPAALPFDRAAHCRRIASYGGMATLHKHGRRHFATIGSAGARVTIERHGYDYWRGLVDAKGWTPPRQVTFLDDLRAGRALAALAAAA
jgi:hypothetical protein